MGAVAYIVIPAQHAVIYLNIFSRLILDQNDASVCCHLVTPRLCLSCLWSTIHEFSAVRCEFADVRVVCDINLGPIISRSSYTEVYWVIIRNELASWVQTVLTSVFQELQVSHACLDTFTSPHYLLDQPCSSAQGVF